MAKRRLGIAVMLEGALGVEVDGLRRGLGMVGVQKMDPHITVVPPFALPETEVEAFVGEVASAVGESEPFEVTLGRPMQFSLVSPVLSLAVDDEEGYLHALSERLFEKSTHRGRTHDFVPHVTLADGLSLRSIWHLLEVLDPPPRRVAVEAVSIMEMAKESPDPRWRPLATIGVGESAKIRRGPYGVVIHQVLGGTDPYGRHGTIGAVAYVGTRLVGVITLQIDTPFVASIVRCEILDQDMTRMGIGSALWAKACDALVGRGVREVFVSDGEQREFFHRLGFEALDDEVSLGVSQVIYGAMSKLWSFSIR